MNEEKNTDDVIQFLIDMGVLKPMGYDESIGEEMYLITQDADDFIPGLFIEKEKRLNSAIFDLWQIDMLDIIFDDNGEPLVSLNKNSMNEEKIESIEDPSLRYEMYAIIQAFINRNKEIDNQ